MRTDAHAEAVGTPRLDADGVGRGGDRRGAERKEEKEDDRCKARRRRHPG